MNTIAIIREIVTLIMAVAAGGLISKIIDLRYRNKSSKGKAEQESNKATEGDLNNSDRILKVYTTMIDDLENRRKANEKEYLDRIRQYELELSDCKSKLNKCLDDLREKSKLIDQLTKSQLSLKMEVQKLTGMLSSNCETCAFKSECPKYKAKLLEDESLND